MLLVEDAAAACCGHSADASAGKRHATPDGDDACRAIVLRTTGERASSANLTTRRQSFPASIRRHMLAQLALILALAISDRVGSQPIPCGATATSALRRFGTSRT